MSSKPITDEELDTIERWLRDERVYVPPQIRRIALLLLAEIRRLRADGQSSS